MEFYNFISFLTNFEFGQFVLHWMIETEVDHVKNSIPEHSPWESFI